MHKMISIYLQSWILKLISGFKKTSIKYTNPKMLDYFSYLELSFYLSMCVCMCQTAQNLNPEIHKLNISFIKLKNYMHCYNREDTQIPDKHLHKYIFLISAKLESIWWPKFVIFSKANHDQMIPELLILIYFIDLYIMGTKIKHLFKNGKYT